MKQDPILLRLLGETGLPQKEAMVYLALLELGAGTVGDISSLTDLKRPIIYVVLESLIKRGYSSVVLGKKINTYQPCDPAVIGSQLSLTARNFLEMTPMLKTLANKKGSRPKISYFDSKDAIWTAYNEVNNYKYAYFATSPSRIEKIFPGSIASWERGYRKKHNKLESKNLIPDNQDDMTIIKNFRLITDKVEGRIFPPYRDYNIDLALYGSRLSIASFSDHPFLVIIDSDELVKTFLPFFELAWRNSTAIE